MKQTFTQTVGSVARALGCDPATVRNAVDAGYVPSIRNAINQRLLPANGADILRARQMATGAIGCRKAARS
jgi:hypothetical protein